MISLLLYGSVVVFLVVVRAPWISSNGLLVTSLILSGSMQAYFVYSGAPWLYYGSISLALVANHSIFYYQFKNRTSNNAQEIENLISNNAQGIKNPLISNNGQANSFVYLSLIFLNIVITVLAGCILGWMGLFSIFLQTLFPDDLPSSRSSLGVLIWQALTMFELAEAVILFNLSSRSWRYMRRNRPEGSVQV